MSMQSAARSVDPGAEAYAARGGAARAEDPEAEGRSGRHTGGHTGAGAEASGRVAALVADEVIPRLLLSCRANAADRRPGAAHVETLARLALSRDPVAAGAQVAALIDGGLGVETALNDLIAPAARRLGDYWHTDAADFVEVALATQRLVSIVRGLGARIDQTTPPARRAPRALIGSPEPERHALGAMIVALTLRARGWRVREAPGASAADFSRLVARERFDLAGLSAASERALGPLAAAVAAIRSASANPRILVAVGGPAFAGSADAATAIGADFGAQDARDAAARAEALLSHGRSS
jgi:methanogenic corrinoid protein MtbC1